MENKFKLILPSEEQIRKLSMPRSKQEKQLIHEYRNNQIQNNKPLIRVLKRLSKT
ncbi:hypothetical protein [Lactobacillus laiwuensis]|uniref:hypothetical protein n=1 Tax=Lactobacillus laiwuensis TaxID=2841034 RepID=UPI001CC77281|nr:hypothetical protein [Lactobacillus laiwuensis]